MFARALDAIGRQTISVFEGVGRASMLFIETCVWIFRPPYRINQLFKAMEFVGVGSLFIVLLTGVFTGAVFALQGAGAFRMFNAKTSSDQPLAQFGQRTVAGLDRLNGDRSRRKWDRDGNWDHACDRTN